MVMDFSGSAGAASSSDVIPAGQLAWAIISYRGLKSSASGGAYLDVELTIDDGQPYARKKLWEMIGDPQNAGNSEKYREMGTIAITRILEAGRNAGPANLAGYQIADYKALDGLRVPIKIKIEEGTNGHADKNKVGEWLTPNPASQSGNKGFVLLTAGQFNMSAKPAAAATTQGGFAGFGAGATTTAAAQPAASGFGNAGGVAAASSGFGKPAGDHAAANTGSATSADNPSTVSETASATTSPSDPGAQPNWLAQANQ